MVETAQTKLGEFNFNLSETLTGKKAEIIKDKLATDFKDAFEAKQGGAEAFYKNVGDNQAFVVEALSAPKEYRWNIIQAVWSNNEADPLGLMSRVPPEGRKKLFELVWEVLNQVKNRDELMEILNEGYGDDARFNPDRLKTDIFTPIGKMIDNLQQLDLLPDLKISQPIKVYWQRMAKVGLELATEATYSSSKADRSTDVWKKQIDNDATYLTKFLSIPRKTANRRASLLWAFLIRNTNDPYRLVEKQLTRDQRNDLVGALVNGFGRAGVENEEIEKMLDSGFDEEGNFDPSKISDNLAKIPDMVGAMIIELYKQRVLPWPEQILEGIKTKEKIKPRPPAERKKTEAEVGEHKVLMTELLINGPIDSQGKRLRQGEIQMRAVSPKSREQYSADFVDNLFEVDQQGQAKVVEYRKRKTAILQLLGLSYLINNDQAMKQMETVCQGNDWFGARSTEGVKEALDYLRNVVENKQGDEISIDPQKVSFLNTVLARMSEFVFSLPKTEKDVWLIKDLIKINIPSAGVENKKSQDMLLLGLLLRDFNQVSNIRQEYKIDQLIKLLFGD